MQVPGVRGPASTTRSFRSWTLQESGLPLLCVVQSSNAYHEGPGLHDENDHNRRQGLCYAARIARLIWASQATDDDFDDDGRIYCRSSEGTTASSSWRSGSSHSGGREGECRTVARVGADAVVYHEDDRSNVLPSMHAGRRLPVSAMIVVHYCKA